MQAISFFIAFVLAFTSVCHLVTGFLELRYADKLSLSREGMLNAVYRRLGSSLLYGAGAVLVFAWAWRN